MRSYDVVVALHVMAVLLAFGLPLALPLLLPYLRRAHPAAMPGAHDVQHRLNNRLTGPFTVLLFLLGAYLASREGLWGEPWVQVPLGVLVVVTVLGGGFVTPQARRMAELARADVEAARGGAVRWSAAYDTAFRRYLAAEVLLGALVLLAVFVMVAKPGA